MQSSEQVNNIAPNYSPEVETEKPITRKRKENDLNGKVLCAFWRDRHCWVAHRQNRVVQKFTHAHIAILASSYSDDVIAIEVKKLKNPYQISRISLGEIPQDLAEKLFLISFPCFQFIRKICKTRFSLSQKTPNMVKTKKLPWQPLLFSILKVSSCQTLPGLSISENLKSKPNRSQKMAMFE